MASKYAEVRCNFYDDIERKWLVDAWKTDNDNEEGTVIAKIDPITKRVKYIDEDAKTDEYAQEVISEMLDEI